MPIARRFISPPRQGFVPVTTLGLRQSLFVTGEYFLDDAIPTQLRELGAEQRFKPLWLEDLASLVRGLLSSVNRNDSGAPSP